jgi:hypothetical protein
MSLSPPPVGEATDSFIFKEWLNKLHQYVGGATGTIPWSQVNKTGSSLTDIAIRNHSTLQAIPGSSEGYHVSSDNYNAIASGIDATVVLAKLSTAGATGQLVFTNGVLTSKTDPT